MNYHTQYENEINLNHVKDYFTGVLENLYGSKDVDLNDLHNCIEEICAALEIKFPEQQLTISRGKND